MLAQSTQMEEMLELLRNSSAERNGGNGEREESVGFSANPGGKTLGFVPKIEFPVFDGSF